jgi:hypothetical protein
MNYYIIMSISGMSKDLPDITKPKITSSKERYFERTIDYVV